ncbi:MULTISPECIES: hypothetical protein [unclassified Streptomyces]|nr:hypothetical protein [Streptomyces sp. NBC_00273]
MTALTERVRRRPCGAALHPVRHAALAAAVRARVLIDPTTCRPLSI